MTAGPESSWPPGGPPSGAGAGKSPVLREASLAAEPAGRAATVERTTRETAVTCRVDLDRPGCRVETGIPFFDHMLAAWSVHGGIGLELAARGDLDVDAHHTVEDVGLCLGRALRQAAGDYGTLARFGVAYVPMDEALARVVVDCSGRPYLVWAVDLPARSFGPFHTDLAEEFWRAVTAEARLTLHIDLLRARNAHHGLEAIWKAAGRAFAQAFAPRTGGPLSTKGVLE
ncbi:MAG: imidazoleglycerol-phosphate dehydratase [Bacillota bacterium]|nr:MAG: imidazoleglycerol-phosphate dehydratase [Bacillota bacterium]